jgi:hypothetical protein
MHCGRPTISLGDASSGTMARAHNLIDLARLNNDFASMLRTIITFESWTARVRMEHRKTSTSVNILKITPLLSGRDWSLGFFEPLPNFLTPLGIFKVSFDRGGPSAIDRLTGPIRTSSPIEPCGRSSRVSESPFATAAPGHYSVFFAVEPNQFGGPPLKSPRRSSTCRRR